MPLSQTNAHPDTDYLVEGALDQLIATATALRAQAEKYAASEDYDGAAEAAAYAEVLEDAAHKAREAVKAAAKARAEAAAKHKAETEALIAQMLARGQELEELDLLAAEGYCNVHDVQKAIIYAPAGLTARKKVDYILHPENRIADRQRLLTLCAIERRPVYIYGETGHGKAAAQETAKEQGFAVYVSHPPDDKGESAQFFGYQNAYTGEIVQTPFSRAFSGGGCFLLEDADTADQGFLKKLKHAIKFGRYYIPGTELTEITAHEDFWLCMTAKTDGKAGTEITYLSSRLLPRCLVIKWDTDEEVLDAIHMGGLEALA